MPTKEAMNREEEIIQVEFESEEEWQQEHRGWSGKQRRMLL